MIRVQCDGCDKVYSVPDQHAGKKMRCKQCSAVLPIPASGATEPPELEPPEKEPAQTEPAEAAAASRPGPSKLGGKGFQRKRTFPTGAGKGIPRRPVGKKLQPRAPQGGKLGGAGLKRKSAPRRRPERFAEEGVEAGAPEARKRKLIVGGGGVVAALAVAAVAYFAFFAGDGGSPAAPGATGSGKTASKRATEGTETSPGSGEMGLGEGTSETGVDIVPRPEEDVPPGPVDSLAVVPADTGVVAYVAFGRLTNVPGLGDKIREARSEEEAAEFFTDANFDPYAHLSALWISVDVAAAQTNPEALPFTVVAEGVFDQEKILQALQARSHISNAPRSLHGRDVYQMLDDEGEIQGYMTFLSAGQVLFGGEDAFNKAIGLLAGGDEVRSNETLADLTGDFTMNEMVWAAFVLPQELKDMLAAKSKELEGQMPPIPVMDGGLLSVDLTPDASGLVVELAVQCASEEEVTKAQQWASGLVLMARQFPIPDELKSLLNGLKIAPEGATLRASLIVPESVLESLKDMPLAIPGAEGPLEGEEPAPETGIFLPPGLEPPEEALEEGPEEGMEEELPGLETEPAEEEELPSLEGAEEGADEAIEDPVEEPIEESAEESSMEEGTDDIDELLKGLEAELEAEEAEEAEAPEAP